MGPLKSDPRINRFLKLFTRLFPIILLLSVIVGFTIDKKILIVLSLPFSIIISIFALFIIEIIGSVSGTIYWPSKKINSGEQFSADLAKARFDKGNGRFKEALTIVSEVLDKDNDFPEALYLKGQILWDGFENSVESKKLFQRVMQLLSPDEELYRWSSYYIDKISEHDSHRLSGSSTLIAGEYTMSETHEEMKSFFDLRVDGYDEHMASTVEEFENFYRKIATPFEKTDDPVKVLDLGAGTGIELEFIFAKAPNAKITAVDLSGEMLKKLVKKYETFSSQIRTIADSYLSLELMPHSFDYIVSVMSFHHLKPVKKIALYKKLRKALIPMGTFVEGDYIVSLEEEKRLLKEFHLQKKNDSLLEDGQYHIDIPFSEETQVRALKDAGFDDINIIFHTSHSNVVVAKSGMS